MSAEMCGFAEVADLVLWGMMEHRGTRIRCLEKGLRHVRNLQSLSTVRHTAGLNALPLRRCTRCCV